MHSFEVNISIYYITYKETSSDWLRCLSTATDVINGLLDVTFQITQNKVILHGLLEVTSESKLISQDPSVTSMVLISQNGKKYITYVYYITKQLLTIVLGDIECY